MWEKWSEPGQGTSTASKTTDEPRVPPLGPYDRKRRETSQAVERRPGQISERHDLAEDSTRQANLEVACWGLRPTTVHYGCTMMDKNWIETLTDKIQGHIYYTQYIKHASTYLPGLTMAARSSPGIRLMSRCWRSSGRVQDKPWGYTTSESSPREWNKKIKINSLTHSIIILGLATLLHLFLSLAIVIAFCSWC